jgi:protoheme IX farnesyltransferase
MMPVVAGAGSTKMQILAYSAALAVIAVIPSFTGMASAVYGIFAAGLSGVFLKYAYELYIADDASCDTRAMRLFRYSILYLFLIFLALGADGALSGFAAGLK